MTQFQRMTETPVPKLIIQLSIPTIITMTVMNLYNVADTAFVGTLGNSASGAVGIVFGLMALLQAIGFLFGQGSGSIISRSLGRQDSQNASEVASTGFFLSFGFGLLESILGLIFLHQLVMFLGSTETIAPHAETYGFYILLTAPLISSSFTLNNLLRFEGKAFLGMVGLVTGAVLNIAGDAILICVFHLGVKGAGISTAISQLISFLILIYSFISGKTLCKISIKKFQRSLKKICDIILTGTPSLLRQGLSCISTIILNQEAAKWGNITFDDADAAVAAMSIVGRVFFFIFAVSIGVGQGYQPVCGFNYGAKKFDRVKKAFWFTVIISQILMILISAAVIPLAPQITRLFRNDDLVVKIAAYSLRLHCLGTLILPYCMGVDMTLQSTGKKLEGIIVSSIRNGLIFIPCIYLMTYFRGLAGLQEAQPVSFVISFFPTLYFGKRFFKKYCK